jgi:hypothetical protein
MLTLSEKQFLKDTADQFRIIRLNKKISQRKVYRDTGINIIRIESGNDNLTLITLKQLCNYYQIALLQFNDQIMSFNQQNNVPGINMIINQQINSTGSVQNASGSIQNPSDSLQNGNGCVKNTSGSFQIKNGRTKNASVTIRNHSDSLQNADGSTQNPNDHSHNISDSGKTHSDITQKIRHRIQNSISSIQSTGCLAKNTNV